MDTDNNIEVELETSKVDLFVDKYKRRKEKKKAFDQFNFNAKPVKLNHFIESIAPLQENIVDQQVEPEPNDDVAPILDKYNAYPVNSDELALGVLEISDTICDLIDIQEEFNAHNLDLSVVDQNFYQIEKQRLNNNKLQVAGDKFIESRMTEPILTAKRLRVKALQLFSFNENYNKHFNIDPGELRSLNIDMMFDESEESVRLLKKFGLKVSSNYNLSGSLLGVINSLTTDQNFYKIVGYSLLLQKTSLWLLKNPDRYISDYYPAIGETVFKTTTFRMIFEFFGLMKFGEHHCLNHLLNYVPLIKNYLHQPKSSTRFKIFSYLDKRSSNYQDNY